MHSKQDFQNVRQILGPGLDCRAFECFNFEFKCPGEVISIEKMKWEVQLVVTVGSERGVNDNRKHGPTNQKVSGCGLL